MSTNEPVSKRSDAVSRPLRVDGARRLPVRSVASMLVKPSGSFKLKWRDPATGGVVYELSIAFAVDGDRASLRLSCDPSRLIRVLAIQQPRGGRRWIFIDPDGFRCTVLLCPEGESRFRSRAAWGRCRTPPSANPRAAALPTKSPASASPSAALAAPLPLKPPGMHFATYDRIIAEAEAAAAIALAGLRALATTHQEPAP